MSFSFENFMDEYHVCNNKKEKGVMTLRGSEGDMWGVRMEKLWVLSMVYYTSSQSVTSRCFRYFFSPHKIVFKLVKLKLYFGTDSEIRSQGDIYSFIIFFHLFTMFNIPATNVKTKGLFLSLLFTWEVLVRLEMRSACRETLCVWRLNIVSK